MEVYGHRSFSLHLPTLLRRSRSRVAALAAAPDYDALVDLFIDIGEAQAAVADVCDPGDAVPVAWSAILEQVASAVCDRWYGRPVRLSFEEIPSGGPDNVQAKTPEGFAQYALLPEQYIVAADRFVSTREPRSLLCVGIRSIGGPLAYLVAAVARARGVAARVVTVRPHGHPFDRRVDFCDRILESHVAIVDEGPGLSGSSFAAASDALAAAGVGADRITLFPSWNAPASALRSERGRAAWERHEHVVVSFEEVWRTDGRTDVSGGKWRDHVFSTGEWPAVHPQHERRKYLRLPVLSRFVGLGRYGRAKLDRGRLLADARFVPQPFALERGFLDEAWIMGRRLDVRDGARRDVLDRIATYAAFLYRHCRTGARARTDDLDIAERFDEPEIAVDGRLLPHEWIDTGTELVKTDALDHHADDFLPGCRDIAWDVAAATIEFDLDAASEGYLVDRYWRLAADRTISSRLPAYKRAWLSYRLAYTTLAAESLRDTPDGQRFTREASRYRRLLG